MGGSRVELRWDVDMLYESRVWKLVCLIHGSRLTIDDSRLYGLLSASAMLYILFRDVKEVID